MIIKMTSSKVFSVIILVLSINEIVLANLDVNNCRQCSAGFFVKDLCTAEHDTICTKCPSNHYMPLDNHLETNCKVCTACPSGFYETDVCSSSKDTQCESCDTKVDSESFRLLCTKTNISQSDLNISNEGLKIDSSLLEEQGSGAEEVDLVLPTNVTVIDDDSILSLGNETEGTGETILEIVKEEVIIPEDGSKLSELPISKNETIIDDDLIPVSPVTLKTTTTIKPQTDTTTKSDAVTTQSVTTSTLKVTTTQSITTPKETTTQTTTARELKSVIGIELDDGKGDDGSEQVIEEITVVPLNVDNVIPEKSYVKNTEAMTDDTDKVSIGIVIAVAIIAAIIFFIIGFIAAKYCRRRRRNFKAMDKARSNGTPHNGSVPVLLENGHSYRPNGIYDEIGKEANGKCSTRSLDEIVPVHHDNVYAVPDKRKKTEPDIKYIDETSDDDLDSKETSLDDPSTELKDKTIPPPIQNGGSRHNLDEGSDEINESSPMLNEIQSEINNHKDDPSEHDSLVTHS